MGDIFDYYNSYSENERLTRRRSRNLERITTMHFLDSYISKESKIADIGCGTGAYCFELAGKVKDVVAVDLIERHIVQIDEKIRERKITNIETHVASATDMKQLKSNSFDIVICLGPLYHLQSNDDRKLCINECKRILKRNGIMLVSYINKQATVSYFAKNKKYFSRELVKAFENNEYGAFASFDDFLSISFCTDPTSIEKEFTDNGFSILKNIAAEGISYFITEQLEEMDDSQWNAYVDYHLKHCEDKNTFGMSSHGILISKKD